MQFDPNEIVGHIACVEAGDETKPEGVFTSKHNEKTAYMFKFDQACTISKEQLIKELQETELNKEAQGPLSYYVLRDLYQTFMLKDVISLCSVKYGTLNQ